MIILIRRKRELICSADGLKFYVRKVAARRDGKVSRLQDVRSVGKFEPITMLAEGWLSRRIIRLQPGLRSAIRCFIREYQTRTNLAFSCYDFANLARGVPPHPLLQLRDFWEMKPLTRKPRKGEVVFLINDETGWFYHAAICLDGHYFISVWGAGGDLEICSFEELIDGYQPPAIVVAVPRC